jgi:hypothetical protein
MANKATIVKTISEEVMRWLADTGSHFVATNLALGQRGHLSTEQATRITHEKVNVTTMRDNAQFLLLVSSADKRFRANGAIIKKISQEFLDFLWEHTDEGVQEALKKKAAAGVKLQASHMATFNCESEAKQFLMIPMIALIAEMYQLADGDLKEAEEAIKSFTDLEPEQMYRFYTAFIAQPERPLDIARRWFSILLERRNEAIAETESIFDGPDGLIAKLRQRGRV